MIKLILTKNVIFQSVTHDIFFSSKLSYSVSFCFNLSAFNVVVPCKDVNSYFLGGWVCKKSPLFVGIFLLPLPSPCSFALYVGNV